MFEPENHQSLPTSGLDLFPSAFDAPDSKDTLHGHNDRLSPNHNPTGPMSEDPSTCSLTSGYYDGNVNSYGAEPNHPFMAAESFRLGSPSSCQADMQSSGSIAGDSLSPTLLDTNRISSHGHDCETAHARDGGDYANNDDFFSINSALPSPVSPFNPNLNFSNSSPHSTPTMADLAFDYDYLHREQWNNSPVNSVFSSSSTANDSVGAFSDMDFDLDDTMSMEAWGTPVSCRSETDLSLPPLSAPPTTAMSLPLSPMSPCPTDTSSSPGLLGLHSKANASSSTLPNLSTAFGGPDDEVYQHEQQHDLPEILFSGMDNNGPSVLSPTTPTSTPYQERPSSATASVSSIGSGGQYTSGTGNRDWAPHLQINTAAAKNLGNELSPCHDNASPPMASPMIAHLFRKFTHDMSLSMNNSSSNSPMPSPSSSIQPRSCSSPVPSASQPTSSAPTSATAATGISRSRTVPRSLTKNLGRVSKRGQKKNIQLPISPRSFSSGSNNFCDLTFGGSLSTPQQTALAASHHHHHHPQHPPSHGQRPKFACIFSPYGCDQLFKCKNEWKRHINTQHLEMEKYLCHIGICRKNLSRLRNGENVHFFNRKDLFMSHLRRHHDPAKPDSYSGPLVFDVNSQISVAAAHESFEKEMQLTCESCYVSTRNPPSAVLGCTYCDATFNNWSRRLEHVGRHIEKGHVPVRLEDTRLRNWAVLEGILAPANNNNNNNNSSIGNNQFFEPPENDMHHPHLHHQQQQQQQQHSASAMQKLVSPWVIQTKKNKAINNNNSNNVNTGR